MDNEPAIIIEDLSKRYSKSSAGQHSSLKEYVSSVIKPKKKDHKLHGDEFWALRRINLTIQKGEVLGIVGRNGSGKSTLLKLITGIITPTTGSVLINGTIASLIEVGAGFHHELTGRENVYFNGAILGMKRNEVDQKLKEIHDFSGIGDFFDTPVKHYSSGMYVRLAFSVAVHVDPEILIIDEVLAVGDFDFKKKSEAKIRSFLEQGKTVLMVSHSSKVVEDLCSRAIMLEKGHLVAEGEPRDVIERYSGHEN